MTDSQTTAAEQFRAAARPIFGTVSGSPQTMFRIAVRNKTQQRAVTELAGEYGGHVRTLSSGYPALLIIEWPATLLIQSDADGID